MIKKTALFFVGALLVFAGLTGCSSPYTPAPQILPQHIKKISVRAVVNNTAVYGLEEKLTLAVIDEFVRDGRLAVTNNEAEANGIVVAEINKYILQPLTYDANMVTEQYKLWVLFNVYFVDRTNNVTLWTEPNMEGIQIFFDASRPGGRTEEEVREDIWSDIGAKIVRRTVEGFGSVSGASDKRIPK